jgi:hypothetical protein
MTTINTERKKVCTECKKEFSCYTSDCWCSELPQIMSLSETEDCLCPQCLKTAIDKKFEEHKVK